MAASLEIHLEWHFHALTHHSYGKFYETHCCRQTVYQLLETLKAFRVYATFYVLGLVAREEPALLNTIFEAGHRIGSHGWQHGDFEREGDELDLQTRQFLPECVGYRPPYWNGMERPGFGGGAFFRMLPYPLLKMEVLRSRVCYLHPHDLHLHPGMLRRSFSIGDPWRKLGRLLWECRWHDPRRA